MKEKRTKGFIEYNEQKRCTDCKYMEWIGSGSRSQKITYCTKIEPNFIVFCEDCCDEFEMEQ